MLLLCGVALFETACGFVFDFDSFDTSDTTTRTEAVAEAGGADAISVTNSAKGVRIRVDPIQIPPGAEASVPITIEWIDAGTPQAVRFTIGHDELLDAAADETFDDIEQINSVSGATATDGSIAQTSFELKTSEKTTPKQRTIFIKVSSADTPDQIYQVPVLVRGKPCAVDPTFVGPKEILRETRFGSGVVIPPLVEGDHHTLDLIRLLGSTPEGFLGVGTLLPGSRELNWSNPLSTTVSSNGPPVLMSVATDGIYIASSLAIERFVRAEDDSIWSEVDGGIDGEAPPSSRLSECTLGGLAADVDGGVGVLCLVESTPNPDAPAYWRVDRRGPDAGHVQGDFVDTYVRKADSHPRKLVRNSAGFIACGTVRTIDGPQLTIIRWAPSSLASNSNGALIGDSRFGLDGRIGYGSRSEAITCSADDEGITVLATIRGKLSVIGIKNDGSLEGKFGDAGAFPLLTPVGDGGFGPIIVGPDNLLTPYEEFGTHVITTFDSLELGGGTVRKILVAGEVFPTNHAYLNEYTRDGRVDRSCDLNAPPINAKRIVGIALDRFARAYIFDSNGVTRVWL